MQLSAKTSPDQVHVLVDFQNVLPRGESLRSLLEVQWILQEILRVACTTVLEDFPTCREMRLHLYGGWIARDARESQQAQWLRAEVAYARTRWRGVRVLPRLATGLQFVPELTLIGTLRRTGGIGMQQKMVDCMMALDAAHLAQSPEPVILWSDDDDLVPAVATIAKRQGTGHLWRRRPPGQGMNDQRLGRLGVILSRVEVGNDIS